MGRVAALARSAAKSVDGGRAVAYPSLQTNGVPSGGLEERPGAADPFRGQAWGAVGNRGARRGGRAFSVTRWKRHGARTMIRTIPLTVFAALAGAAPAFAHVGHIGEVAGHGHWIGLAALGGAAAIALAATLAGRARKKADRAAEDSGDDAAGASGARDDDAPAEA